MGTEISDGELKQFRALILRRFGLAFDETKSELLAEVIRTRLAVLRENVQGYLLYLETKNSTEELRAIAKELTVGETYFFRYNDQFRAFAEQCLPNRMLAQAKSKRLKILSAACSTGEEAYSLAIILKERLSALQWDLSVTGVDLNVRSLEGAVKAKYSKWALRETTADIEAKYFRHADGRMVLDDSIRRMVQFQELNLTDSNEQFWRPGSFDIVFCRNVIMYFGTDYARDLISRIAASLMPGGYLFLGHAETLRGLSQDFHLCHTHDAFYYQRKDSLGADVGAAWVANQYSPSNAVELADVVASSDSWVETIRNAASRIDSLTAASREKSAALSPQIIDLAVPLDLLRRERFAEALEFVNGLPPDSQNDKDVLLLTAALLTHAGQLEKAEAACGKLLMLEELNAGAHYLIALCKEASGDKSAAVDHDQRALYLDPGFAMARLHLGLLARKTDNHETARGELELALELLQREDASRLLLFGGGFSREALSSLCRAELEACRCK